MTAVMPALARVQPPTRRRVRRRRWSGPAGMVAVYGELGRCRDRAGAVVDGDHPGAAWKMAKPSAVQASLAPPASVQAVLLGRPGPDPLSTGCCCRGRDCRRPRNWATAPLMLIRFTCWATAVWTEVDIGAAHRHGPEREAVVGEGAAVGSGDRGPDRRPRPGRRSARRRVISLPRRHLKCPLTLNRPPSASPGNVQLGQGAERQGVHGERLALTPVRRPPSATVTSPPVVPARRGGSRATDTALLAAAWSLPISRVPAITASRR
jgi:hypothetical protein